MYVNFSEQEINWLNNYAGNHGLTIPAAVRQALRIFSLVEATPGALDWLTKQTRDQLGSKYEPMPALETEVRLCPHCGKSEQHEHQGRMYPTPANATGTLPQVMEAAIKEHHEPLRCNDCGCPDHRYCTCQL